MNKSNNERLAVMQQMIAGVFNPSKVQPIRSNNFEELNHFRQKLDAKEEGPFHQPYEHHKPQAILYRYLFLGISLVFALLMGFVHFRTASWICNLFFAHFVVAKTTLSAFCGLLAVLSFYIGFRIRPEREAVYSVCRQVKKKLSQAYETHCGELGVSPFVAYVFHPTKTKHLRHRFRYTLTRMEEEREEAIALLACISNAQMVDEEKIKLYNQAVIEFREKLKDLVK